jgi:Flp pilus assembly protein TadD
MNASPPHRDARAELALVLAERGDDARAIELLEEDVRAGQATPVMLRNLAKLYARGGRLIEAAALLQRARGNSEPPAASK